MRKLIKSNCTQEQQPFLVINKVESNASGSQKAKSQDLKDNKIVNSSVVKDTKVSLEALAEQITEKQALLASLETEIADKTNSSEEVLANARKEAEEIIIQAKLQAGEILLEARKQSEQIIKEFEEQGLEQGKTTGYQEGYQQGFETGKAEAQQEGFKLGLEEGQTQGFIEIQAQMKASVDEASEQAQKMLATAQEQAAALINSCPEKIQETIWLLVNKILHKQLSLKPEYILSIVTAALEKVSSQAMIKITVAPANKDLVAKQLPQLKQLFEANTTVEVFSDDSLGKADVLIETNNGLVDARLDTQISILRMCVEEIFANV